MVDQNIKEILDNAYLKFNQKNFIENDPISIPHLFTKKEDLEIAGFFAATLAWGNRKSIIKNCTKLLDLMDMQPHDFILNHSKKELKLFEKFVHRTFNTIDCSYFIISLKNIYINHKGLSAIFNSNKNDIAYHIFNFRKIFFELNHLTRTEKHVSNPLKNSSSKRICMYLRWMVRKDSFGVDFGIWNHIKPSQLYLPLDVHTGNVSRYLGLLNRKQNDWKAVTELTEILKLYDSKDPVKYDFSLFGLGIDGLTKKINFL